jgi:hypothetical protein
MTPALLPVAGLALTAAEAALLGTAILTTYAALGYNAVRLYDEWDWDAIQGNYAKPASQCTASGGGGIGGGPPRTPPLASYGPGDAGVPDAAAGPQRGIGGKGWRGDRDWRAALRAVESGGTIRDFNGTRATQQEAIDLIQQAGGRVDRIDPPHAAPNPHDFPHINYTTPSGGRGTIEILP